MNRYGKIIALLNQEQLVIQIDEDFSGDVKSGVELTVFALANAPQLKKIGLPAIYAPKGKVRLVLAQDKNLFLAERYREGGHVERRPLAALDFFTEEVRIGSTWSAEIKEEETLGVEFDKELKVNDVVGLV